MNTTHFMSDRVNWFPQGLSDVFFLRQFPQGLSDVLILWQFPNCFSDVFILGQVRVAEIKNRNALKCNKADITLRACGQRNTW